MADLAAFSSSEDEGAGLREICVNSELVHQGHFLQLRRDEVRLPDGGVAHREYLVHPGAVMVIPAFDDGTVLLERQFRYPVGQVMIEFPAGKLDEGEDPLDCAKRELAEETGYRAREWHHLGCIHPVISYSTERIEIFLARGLTRGERQLDAGEFLDIFITPLATLIDGIRSGQVTDVKTIIGAHWLEKFLSGEWPLDTASR